MKKLATLLLIIVFSNSFAQKREIDTFIYGNDSIQYSRLDYSYYGLGQIFITSYQKSSSSHLVEKNAINHLNKLSRLYHTYYYFIEIPESLDSKEEKEKFFSSFMQFIFRGQKIKKVDVYLNFDQDYSRDYLLNYKPEFVSVKRVSLGVNYKTIGKSLSIR